MQDVDDEVASFYSASIKGSILSRSGSVHDQLSSGDSHGVKPKYTTADKLEKRLNEIRKHDAHYSYGSGSNSAAANSDSDKQETNEYFSKPLVI